MSKQIEPKPGPKPLPDEMVDALAYIIFASIQDESQDQDAKILPDKDRMAQWRQEIDTRHKYRNIVGSALHRVTEAGLQIRIRKQATLDEFSDKLVTVPAYRSYNPSFDSLASS